MADGAAGTEVAVRVGEGWEVHEISRAQARPLIVENHYLHSMPGVVPCAVGLFVDGVLGGVCVWAIPPRETEARYGGRTWELARLWLLDELPRNSESWFISRAVKHVRKAHPGVEYAVSYADPSAGHRGTIYYASNWRYEGMMDAERKTPRWDYYRNGKRVGRAVHASYGVIEKRRRMPKHRFSLEVA